MKIPFLHGLHLLLIIITSGCSSIVGEDSTRPISDQYIGAVIAEVKRQVSIYYDRRNRFLNDPKVDQPLRRALDQNKICDRGEVDFNIVSVNMEITTTESNTIGGSAGASSGLVGVALINSRSESSTKKLTIPIYVAPVGKRFVYIDKTGRLQDVADTLFNLRRRMILASTQPGVCFTTWNFHSPKDDKGGSLAMGFAIADVQGASLNLVLAPVSGSVAAGFTSSTGNVLTFNFQQSDVPADGKLKRNAPQTGVTISPSPTGQTIIENNSQGPNGVFDVGPLIQ